MGDHNGQQDRDSSSSVSSADEGFEDSRHIESDKRRRRRVPSFADRRDRASVQLQMAQMANYARQIANDARNVQAANIGVNEMDSDDIDDDVANDEAQLAANNDYQQGGEESDDESHNEEESNNQQSVNKEDITEASDNEDEEEDQEGISDNEDAASTDECTNEILTHKSDLERLRDIDPEFYAFLNQNDRKLLDFKDDEDSQVDDSDDDDDEDADALVHKPSPGQLQVASDEESDEEVASQGDDGGSATRVTKRRMRELERELQQCSAKNNKPIIEATKAFSAAVRMIHEKPQGAAAGDYVVKGATVFNAVIECCIVYLEPAVRRYLNAPADGEGSVPLHKCKRFPKLKAALKQYFVDLGLLLAHLPNGPALNALLKHLRTMIPMLASFPTTSKMLMKELIHAWSTGGDREGPIVAFRCILRIVTDQKEPLLGYALRRMYVMYVRSSHFVSVTTLPAINFMRRSLAELYALNFEASYVHVFAYIRQLAITLRNATTEKKRENLNAVYNWQFICSCRLWGQLLGQVGDTPRRKELLFPFVQIVSATMELVPVAQYFPLRFHLARVLIDLSCETGVYVSILANVLNVLTTYDFNKKHTRASVRPLNFMIMLRAGKAQMAENSFKDAVIDSVYELALEFLAKYAHRLPFCDMVVDVRTHVHTFVQRCTNAKLKKKMQQLLEKVEENCEFNYNAQRRLLDGELDYLNVIVQFETELQNAGMPLRKFYDDWRRMQDIKRRKQVTDNEAIGEYNLPTISKRKRREAALAMQRDAGPPELFPKGSDDEEDEEGEDEDEDDQVEENKEDVNGEQEDEDDEEEKPETKKRKRGQRGSKASKVPRFEDGSDDGSDEGRMDVVEDVADW